jgi:hypothetical protein
VNDDPATTALRSALTAAISGAIGASGGSVPLDVIGALVLEAGTLALQFHAQRRGVAVTVDVLTISEERPE